jgi:hypothetical protein
MSTPVEENENTLPAEEFSLESEVPPEIAAQNPDFKEAVQEKNKNDALIAKNEEDQKQLKEAAVAEGKKVEQEITALENAPATELLGTTPESPTTTITPESTSTTPTTTPESPTTTPESPTTTPESPTPTPESPTPTPESPTTTTTESTTTTSEGATGGGKRKRVTRRKKLKGGKKGKKTNKKRITLRCKKCYHCPRATTHRKK